NEALQDHMDSYNIAKQHGLTSRMAKALNNMGIVYMHIKDYDRALATYQEALTLNKQLNNVEETGSNLANCGLVLVNQNKLDSALVFYHQALSHFLDVKMIRGIATMYNNIGNIYLRKKQYEEALFYFRKSLENYQKDNNVLFAANVYNNIGKAYFLQGIMDSVEPYMMRGLQLATQQNALEEMQDCHENLSLYYEKKGDIAKSLYHLQQYSLWHDSLYNNKKITELKQVAERYEVQRQLDIVNKENELQSARFLSWIVSLAALLIIVTLIGVIYNISLTRNTVRKALYEEEKARFLAEKEAQELRENQYTQEIDVKNRELASTAINIIQKNDLLQQITDNLENLRKSSIDDNTRREITRMTRLIENGLNQEQEWESFRLHFEGVHPGFFDRLLLVQPKLTPKDLRICAYLRMNLSTKEIASLLNFSIRGVETIRYRLRKKLDLPPETDLNNWMMVA
ncbi:MAG: tetratricopeptide repeat protein, partial [Saprospiraceae bacterium]